MPKLILASSSPRRQNYFKEMGLNFVVVSPDIDETSQKTEKPRDYVKRVACAKARKVRQSHIGAIVVAADTTVAVGRRILGKPENKQEAEQMLRLMSGRRHQVISSVCVIDSEGHSHEALTKTSVKLKVLSEGDIARHTAQEDNWQGKAGGYGIQTTAGSLLVSAIIGSYTGVVGMPLVETINLLRRSGIVL
jgi:septum formation protein